MNLICLANEPPPIFAKIFPVLFIGMWCSVSLLLAYSGGWARLAKRFRTNDEPIGRNLRWNSGRVGGTNYSGCLQIHVAPEGVYLSVLILFRLGHPPLFIPWTEIHNERIYKLFWVERMEFDVGSPRIATLQLPKRVFEERRPVG